MKMSSSHKLRLGALCWFLFAFTTTGLGFLQLFPPPFPQGILGILTIALFITFWKNLWFHNAILQLSIHTYLMIHLTRFIGFYFLVLYEEGRLPYEFAVLGGWGDIIVAGGALLLLIFSIRIQPSPRLLALWNFIGLIDILFAVSTAARLGMNDSNMMYELTTLPLGLLPTFLVPIIISSHVFLFFHPSMLKEKETLS